VAIRTRTAVSGAVVSGRGHITRNGTKPRMD
jgi:hypothetical protein